MHSPGVSTQGRVFAFLRRGCLVAKLPSERMQRLLEDGSGAVFEAGRGRAMREWVTLAPPERDTCTDSMVEALEFVKSLPAAAGARRQRFR